MTNDTGGLLFELQYRRECYAIQNGKYIRLEERDTEIDPDTGELKVPLVSPSYTPMRGSHKDVFKEADKLNKIQEKYGFMDYFYFPDVPKMEKVQ